MRGKNEGTFKLPVQAGGKGRERGVKTRKGMGGGVKMDYMNLYKRIILTPQDGLNLSSLQGRNRMYFKLRFESGYT